MPNYDYANSAGLTALSERTFEKIKSKITTDVVTSEAANPLVIDTAAAQYAKNTHLTLEPVQDLHGYDHPWPAGGGKNLLPMTVEGIKAANTNGSWSGNTYTYNGVTFTIQTDSDGNITGILLNGTSTAVTILYINSSFTIKSGSYVLNGAPQSSETETWRLQVNTSELCIDTGGGVNITVSEDYSGAMSFIRVGSNRTLSNILFKPMIRLSTDSEDYAPYSNICPITPMGHRNLLPMTVEGIKAANTTGVWSGNTYAIYGLTFELEVDGDGNVIGIKVNGTASVAMSFWFQSPTAKFSVKNGSILTGCPSGGSDSTYGWGVSGYSWDYGNGETMRRDATSRAAIWVNVNVTINNLVFKPMIRPAFDLDSTFVPYGTARIVAKTTGFNHWDEEYKLGLYDVNNGGFAPNNTHFACKNPIPVTPNTEYHFRTNGYNINVCYLDNKLNYIDNFNSVADVTRTTPSNCHYIVFNMAQAYGTTYNHDICINISDAEKNGTYEPYQGYTASVDLPTTIYGGTLNLETGELVCDRGIKTFDGSESWQPNGNMGVFIYVVNVPSAKIDVSKPLLLEEYEFLPSGEAPTANGKANFNRALTAIQIHDERGMTASAYKTFLASHNIRMAYYLESPITYHLTPAQLDLLKGTNVITVNGKTIQVTYREGSLATLEELNAISFDLSNVKSKLPPIIIKDGMLQVTYDDGQ